MYWYAVLEIAIANYAILLPVALNALAPLLGWSYRNGDGGLAFFLTKTVICLVAVGIPATILGATFPLTLRAFSQDANRQATLGSRLYAANTAGAAAGAAAAGFLLLPALGVTLTTLAGALGSLVAAAIAWGLARTGALADLYAPPPAVRGRRRAAAAEHVSPGQMPSAMMIVALTGFAGLLYEVSWTRAVASLLGPTTYAFAGTVSVLITGLALGGAAGSVLVARGIRPHTVLALTLFLTACGIWLGNSMLGREVPGYLAQTISTARADSRARHSHGCRRCLPLSAAAGVRTGTVTSSDAAHGWIDRERAKARWLPLRCQHSGRRARHDGVRLAAGSSWS